LATLEYARVVSELVSDIGFDARLPLDYIGQMRLDLSPQHGQLRIESTVRHRGV